VSRIRNPIGQVSLSALEDKWQRDATAAAIAAARDVSRTGGPIPPGTPIGRLSDIEWGWIVAGILFAWISKRAEQAAAEQLDTEQVIRMTALDPQPWDAGAVAAILPDLVSALVFVGDAFEEEGDKLIHEARELGRLGVRCFMFQEGDDHEVKQVFQAIADVTKGAYCRFDPGAARQLAELLRAVAVYAAGGMSALEARQDAGAVKLLSQMR
jgi:hypothetical protein